MVLSRNKKRESILSSSVLIQCYFYNDSFYNRTLLGDGRLYIHVCACLRNSLNLTDTFVCLPYFGYPFCFLSVFLFSLFKEQWVTLAFCFFWFFNHKLTLLTIWIFWSLFWFSDILRVPCGVINSKVPYSMKNVKMMPYVRPQTEEIYPVQGKISKNIYHYFFQAGTVTNPTIWLVLWPRSQWRLREFFP